MIAPQIHSNPQIVEVVGPKHIDPPCPLGGFYDNTNRKVLPGNAEQPVASLTHEGTDGSEQLRKAVAVCRATFGTPASPAFLFHPLNITRGISITFNLPGRGQGESFLLSL
jgi:hypothetical protein